MAKNVQNYDELIYVSTSGVNISCAVCFIHYILLLFLFVNNLSDGSEN